MDRKSCLVIAWCLLALASSPAAAQLPWDLARIPAPEIRHFDRFDEKSETLHLLDVKEEYGPKSIVEIVDGLPILRQEKSFQRTVLDSNSYSTKKIRALSLKGEELKLADVLAKLEHGDPVLILNPEAKISPTFQKLLRDDVV